jgi:hypothetical protein
MDHGLTWTLALYPELIGGLYKDPNREGRLFAGNVAYSTRPGGAYISIHRAEGWAHIEMTEAPNFLILQSRKAVPARSHYREIT